MADDTPESHPLKCRKHSANHRPAPGPHVQGRLPPAGPGLLVQGRYEPVPMGETEDGVLQGYSAALDLSVRWERRFGNRGHFHLNASANSAQIKPASAIVTYDHVLSP